MNFIYELERAFELNSNLDNTAAMSKYMKNRFSFYGIKTIERRFIFKEIWKHYKKEVSENARLIAGLLYKKPQRELHYSAIEILIKELKGNYIKDDIDLIENLIITNSWWDSVDTIAKYILGEYLLEFPEETISVIERFAASGNMWLNRSAILFQIGYKKKTNPELLFSLCRRFSESNEFFIRKAIGWALREYGKTDPEAVKQFVSITKLKPLSIKEALKNLD